MIEMPGLPHTNDEKLDGFVKNFITEAIRTKLLNVITVYESKNDFDLIMYREDMLEDYFPNNFPSDNNEKMLETMKALYSLIISDEYWVPTLLMEYVLAKVIEYEVSDFYDFHMDSIQVVVSLGFPELEDEFEANTIAFYRKHYYDLIEKQLYINETDEADKTINVPFSKETFTKLVNAYKKEGEAEGWFDKDETEESKITECEEIVDNIWHFSKEWLEWCFWDTDYMLLDDMEIGTLRHHYVNKMAAILPEDAKDDEYFLPKDWKNSKDFKFLNCEDE